MQTSKLIFLVMPVLLSGCAVAPVVLTGISVSSVAVSETTGKSISDHTVSHVAGQDCSIGRVFRDQAICQHKGLNKLQVTNTGVAASTIADIEARYKQ